MSVAATHTRSTSSDPALPFARTLVFAPHPDDESLGAGGLLAHVAHRGANVRIVFLTSGENNPWPQRKSRRQWRITAADRRQWGRKRRREARRALLSLGIAPQDVTFLGFPDNGLSRLDRATLAWPIANAMIEFHPTLLVIPSIDDLHPDHRAAYRATMQALSAPGVERPLLTLSYVVHGDLKAPNRMKLTIDEDERARKRDAVGRHGTQLLLSRRRFLRYATRDEQFGIVSDFCAPEETWVGTWIAKVRHLVSVLWWLEIRD